jgi:hypothetical protein
MPWRDSEGRASGGSYHSWIDRQIAAAEQRGEFDDLPGTGKPLKHLGNPDDPDWWVKQLIAREQLDMSVALPPQLALRKEAHELPDRVLRERSEQAVRDLVDDFNARVRDCWRQPLEGPPVVVRPVDPEEIVAHWRARQTHRPRLPRPEAELEPMLDRRATPGWLRRALSRIGLSSRHEA